MKNKVSKSQHYERKQFMYGSRSLEENFQTIDSIWRILVNFGCEIKLEDNHNWRETKTMDEILKNR